MDGREPAGTLRLLLLVLLTVLVLGGVALVWFTGGTRGPAVHVMYLPILLAAVFEGRAGGVAFGIVAAVALGPWMPLDVAAGEGQPSFSWVARGTAFVLIGGVAGQIQLMLGHRLDQVKGLLEKISEVHAKTLSTLASTVELRDEPTGGHCTRVAHNVRAVAQALEMGEEAQRTVYWAGLLHDLGKTAIAERILQKPARLTEDEWTEMRRHSVIGAELLESVSPEFRAIAAGVRAHHERWDGGGYPDGLAGEDIPMVGRIVTVVDVFEALTCSRPYREPASIQEALAHLRTSAGTQFDPALVPVFEDLYWKGAIHTAIDPRSHLAMTHADDDLSAQSPITLIRRLPAARPAFRLDSTGLL
ncbi:MAG: HD-GYP domain-containing protein [Actinomycetota bacterium]